MPPTFGLVLSGGGARSAYQVGALRAIAELTRQATPFQVVTGVSGGAINAAAVASSADDFAGAVGRLDAVWRRLDPTLVYRTDPPALAAIVARWLVRLAGGGLVDGGNVNALLDTAPLRRLLGAELAVSRIRGHVAAGRLRGAAVTATAYASGTAISFYDAVPEVLPWARTGRIGRRSALTLDHVMASAAIPIFFPPVLVDGVAFGDGCVRLTAPLSPAIHLGADKLVAIGIRYARTAAETLALDRPGAGQPAPAEIGGVLLNAVFLDSLETDVERLTRINGTLSLLDAAERAALPQPLRPIPVLALRPSVDLGHLAVQRYHQLPGALRYLLRGLGADGQRGWDLVSYLAFEPVYLRTLIDLGYADTMARGDEVRAFFGTAPRAAAIAR